MELLLFLLILMIASSSIISAGKCQCVFYILFMLFIYDHRDFAIVSTFCWSWNKTCL